MALTDGNTCPSDGLAAHVETLEASERLFPFQSAHVNDKSDSNVSLYKLDILATLSWK